MALVLVDIYILVDSLGAGCLRAQLWLLFQMEAVDGVAKAAEVPLPIVKFNKLAGIYFPAGFQPINS